MYSLKFRSKFGSMPRWPGKHTSASRTISPGDSIDGSVLRDVPARTSTLPVVAVPSKANEGAPFSRKPQRTFWLLACSALAVGLAFVAAPWKVVRAAGVGAAGTGVVNPAFGSYGDYIPIHVPGYYNLEPAFKLVYNSAAGNGFLGMGWSESVHSFVERAGWKGKGTGRYDSSDTFLLDGSLLLSGTNFGGTHVTQHQSYLRIQQDKAKNQWIVWEKNGTKKTYGPVYVAKNAGNPGFDDVFRWALTRVEDPNGHSVSYNYWTDPNQNSYLDSISYNGYSIKFWRELRPDPISFTDGINVRYTRFRLKTIEVKVGNADRTAYKLTYSLDGGSSHSLLTSVQQFGTDVVLDTSGTVTAGTSTPSQSMTYSPSRADYSSISWQGGVGAWNPAYHYFLGDVNADGKDDLVIIWDNNGVSTAQVTQSDGKGFTNTTSNRAIGGWDPSWHDFLMDVDGDGKADFVRIYNSNGTARCQVNPSDGKGFPNQSWNAAIGGWSTDYRYYFADVDGDGFPDLIVLYTTGDGVARCQVNLNDQHGHFPNQNSNLAIGGWSKDYRYFFSDINGDGRADLEVIYTTGDGQARCQVSPSNGTGFPSQSSNTIVGGWSPSYVYNFVDINGDGKADMSVIYTHGDGVARCQIDLSNGDGFPVQHWNGAIGGWSPDWRYFFQDANGDGRPDIIVMWHGGDGSGWAQISLFDGQGYGHINWNASVGGWDPKGGQQFFFANITGDGKPDFVEMWHAPNGTNMKVRPATAALGYAPPDLLKSITNGVGGTTNIVYEKSTDWPSKHTNRGGVFATVSEIVVDDGRGKSGRTSYGYADAFYSPTDQIFFGFRSQAAVVDDQGTTVETFLRQTVESIGQRDSVYTKNAAGAIYAYTTYAYAEAGDGLKTPYTSQVTQISQFESNLTNASRQTRSSYLYDSFGNQTQVIDEGDVGATGDEFVKVITYNYNSDSSHYLVETARSEQIYSGTTILPENKVDESLFYYDGAMNTATPPFKGNMTRSDKWNNQTGAYVSTSSQFDTFGNLVSTTNARGFTETMAYDPVYHQRPISTSNALGQTNRISWDYVLGVTTSTTNLNGFTSTISYDPLGRPISVTNPDGKTSTTQHISEGDPNKQHIRQTIADGSPEGLWTDTYSDGLGRGYLTVKKGPSPDVTYSKQVVYKDGQSEPQQASLWYPTGAVPVWEKYEYDGAGRKTKTIHPDGSFATTSYTMDTAGKPCTIITDELGHQHTIWTDIGEHVTRIQETNLGANYNTFKSYDVLGRLLRVTDDHGNTSNYTTNSLGQVTSSQDQDLGTVSSAHDNGGLLISSTNPKGETSTATYDALDRMLTWTSASGETTRYYYDEPGHGPSIGKLTRTVYPSGSVSYMYGNRSALISVTRTIGSESKTMDSRYDSLMRVQTVTYPDGEIVAYTYTADGNLGSVSGYVASMVYGPNGEVTQITYANGTKTNYTYDPNRLWLNTADVTSNGTSLYTASYTYDALQRVTSMTQGTPTPKTTKYSYDDLSRLLSVGGNQTQSFTYDSVGNITNNSSVGGYTYGDPDHKHAVTSAGSANYTYDANGSMLTGNGKTLVWDDHDRLSSVAQAGQTTLFSYGAGTDRVRKSSGANTTLYFGATMEEFNGSGIQYYYAGPLLVAKKDAAGTKTWYHADRLGSTRVMTNAAGADVKDYDYLPFGSVASTSGTMANERTYTGHISDAETGLMYCGARYYDATLGRFISADTATSGDDPQDLNAYSYCVNNPINATDPSGHRWVSAGWETYTDTELHMVTRTVTINIPYVIMLPKLEFFWRQVTIATSIPTIAWTPFPTIVWQPGPSITISVPDVRIVMVPFEGVIHRDIAVVRPELVSVIKHRELWKWVQDVAPIQQKTLPHTAMAASGLFDVIGKGFSALGSAAHGVTDWASKHQAIVSAIVVAAVVVTCVVVIVASGGVGAALAGPLAAQLISGVGSAAFSYGGDLVRGNRDFGDMTNHAIVQGGIGFFGTGAGALISKGVNVANGVTKADVIASMAGKNLWQRSTQGANLVKSGIYAGFNFGRNTLNNHINSHMDWGTSMALSGAATVLGAGVDSANLANNFSKGTQVVTTLTNGFIRQGVRSAFGP